MRINKLSLLGAATVITLTGASTVALQSQTSGAEDVPPIYTQVENHEQRIGTLETRADDTDAKVEQNSADIQVVQQRTGGSTAPSSSSGGTSVGGGTTSAPAPSQPASEPTPTPEPVIDPRTITGVSESVTGGLRTCDYALHDWNEDTYQGVIIQPAERPCYAVGEVLPR